MKQKHIVIRDGGDLLDDDSYIQKAASTLIDAGNIVKGNPEECAVNLRLGVNSFNNLVLNSKVTSLIFISYVLDFYMEDVWSNIAVDSSYRSEIKDEDSVKVLCSIADGFIKLGGALMQKDYYMSYDICANLVSSYLDAIADINRRLEKSDDEGI